MVAVKDLEKEVAEVGKLARLVVAKRVAIVAVVAVALNLLIAYHIITPDMSNSATGYIKDVLDGIAALVAVLYAQKGVTPLVDPRDDSGQALIPVSSVLNAIVDDEADDETVPPTPADEDVEPVVPEAPTV
jgi:hypothetical protein